MKFTDLTGQKFNKLTVIKRVDNLVGKKSRWLCKCDCGKETVVDVGNLKNGHTKSCGCYRIAWATVSGKHFKKHGMWGHPAYESWKGMFSRLRKAKKCNKYHHYVENKIKICERWNKLENFIEDMLPSWFEGAQIDRIDNEGDYEPRSCKWSTRKEQMNNTHYNVKLTFEGRTQNAVQWAEELGISAHLIRERVRRYHWSAERALTTPSKKIQHDIIKNPTIK